tara:strand:+ start:1850 stop:2590 length:741 start_codon:yes stop_codon:yes gene_type:complete
MRECVIIPARYKSSRLPGKPLRNILGTPLVLLVAEIASKAVGLENVFVATDDQRIAKVVNNKGFKYIMTSDSALTGTDRVAEAAIKLNYDVFVNVQGDEPLLDHNDIIKSIEMKKKNPNCIINSYNLIDQNQDPLSLNIPKVIINESNYLVYISRSLIPGYKDYKLKPVDYKKQVCIYAFNRKELNDFLAYGKKSYLEEIEDIEILRFLELGYSIKMFKSNNSSLAVDVEADITLVENELNRRRLL